MRALLSYSIATSLCTYLSVARRRTVGMARHRHATLDKKCRPCTSAVESQRTGGKQIPSCTFATVTSLQLLSNRYTCASRPPGRCNSASPLNDIQDRLWLFSNAYLGHLQSLVALTSSSSTASCPSSCVYICFYSCCFYSCCCCCCFGWRVRVRSHVATPTRRTAAPPPPPPSAHTATKSFPR